MMEVTVAKGLNKALLTAIKSAQSDKILLKISLY